MMVEVLKILLDVPDYYKNSSKFSGKFQTRLLDLTIKISIMQFNITEIFHWQNNNSNFILALNTFFRVKGNELLFFWDLHLVTLSRVMFSLFKSHDWLLFILSDFDAF